MSRLRNSNVEKLEAAQHYLRKAIYFVRFAEAPKTLKKLISARASIGGAIRHAHHKRMREDMERSDANQ